jgi:hypothetical protein
VRITDPRFLLKGKITALSHLNRMTVRFESGKKVTFEAPYSGIRKL